MTKLDNYYGAIENNKINRAYYFGSIELNVDDVVENENNYFKNKIEYNQYYINNSICTIITPIGILSNYFNYRFNNNQILDAVSIAKKWNPPFVDGVGWYIDLGAKLGARYRNKIIGGEPVVVYTLDLGSDDFYELLKKGYHIQTGYRGNKDWNKDMKDDCILNEVESISNPTYGHSIYLGMKDGDIYVIDSYKGRKCNVYKVDNFEKRRKLFFKHGYVFIPLKNIMNGLEKDIALVEKALGLGITKNKANLENIKKGKYTQDVKTIIMIMRAYNLLESMIKKIFNMLKK